jgi:RNA polymerase sigma-70 factor (ECF subfamily)
MLPQYDHLEDEELWTKIREGDRDALEVLYRRLFGFLHRYGCKIFHNATLVEDAIHDLFLDLWRYRENLFATTSVRFYLFSSLKRRIIRNKNSTVKAAHPDFPPNQSLLQEEYNPEEIIIRDEQYDERMIRLKKHLQDLPPKQYEALLLKFYNELSYEEIAASLNIKEQSARNLVQRGLQLLSRYTRIMISGSGCAVLFTYMLGQL